MRRRGLYQPGGAALAAVIGVAVSALVANAADSDGMFGIHMGDDLATLSVGGVLEPHLYRLHVVPDPNPYFPYYQVRHHPATGVCMAAGVTSIIVDSGPGEELRRRFMEIKTSLEAEFGETGLSDRVILDNRPDWRRHFMTFLKDEKAILAAQWSYNQGHDLGPERREILLVADGISSSQAAIILQVKFNNYVECIRAMRRDSASAEEDMPEPRTVRVFRGNAEPESDEAAEQSEDAAEEGPEDGSGEGGEATEEAENEESPPIN